MSLLAKQEALSHLDGHEENYHNFLKTELVTAFNKSVLVDFAYLESWFGLFYSDAGRYKEAEELHRRVIGPSERALGPQHPNTLTSINNFASLLQSQGKHKEAKELHRSVIGLSETTLGL
jgi:hypothetical protein